MRFSQVALKRGVNEYIAGDKFATGSRINAVTAHEFEPFCHYSIFNILLN